MLVDDVVFSRRIQEALRRKNIIEAPPAATAPVVESEVDEELPIPCALTHDKPSIEEVEPSAKRRLTMKTTPIFFNVGQKSSSNEVAIIFP